jgi:hypothetical protein
MRHCQHVIRRTPELNLLCEPLTAIRFRGLLRGTNRAGVISVTREALGSYGFGWSFADGVFRD